MLRSEAEKDAVADIAERNWFVLRKKSEYCSHVLSKGREAVVPIISFPSNRWDVFGSTYEKVCLCILLLGYPARPPTHLFVHQLTYICKQVLFAFA